MSRSRCRFTLMFAIAVTGMLMSSVAYSATGSDSRSKKTCNDCQTVSPDIMGMNLMDAIRLLGPLKFKLKKQVFFNPALNGASDAFAGGSSACYFYGNSNIDGKILGCRNPEDNAPRILEVSSSTVANGSAGDLFAINITTGFPDDLKLYCWRNYAQFTVQDLIEVLAPYFDVTKIPSSPIVQLNQPPKLPGSAAESQDAQKILPQGLSPLSSPNHGYRAGSAS